MTLNLETNPNKLCNILILAILKYNSSTEQQKKELKLLNPDPLVSLVESRDLEELRDHDNLDAFEVFVLYVIPPVVRKMLFRAKRLHDRVSSFVTIPDEAFAMLILENNAEKWRFFYNSSSGLLDADGKKTKPKYCPTNTNASQSSYTGNWTEKGIERYNELCDLVQSRREESHVVEDEKYLLERMHSMFGKKSGYYRRDVEEEDPALSRKRVKMAYNGLNKYKNKTAV